ncbi:hypothetical protein QAD02_008008 [Eretmocerus hayati]|uniref:Uncharacterized protein n=1 Tax=Eretmocerus hayati TaxID=131215 RepID=A0ACC2N629_9HYME|nr:hypothetical protein QAD02_008008 [Eretmocerus hayati]
MPFLHYKEALFPNITVLHDMVPQTCSENIAYFHHKISRPYRTSQDVMAELPRTWPRNMTFFHYKEAWFPKITSLQGEATEANIQGAEMGQENVIGNTKVADSQQNISQNSEASRTVTSSGREIREPFDLNE